MRRSIALCLLALTGLSRSIHEGVVTHVRDGDTIEVEGVAVRLQGLHAPEMGEMYGRAARAFMIDLVDGKRVRCDLSGERSHDRQIGICYLGRTDIAAELIKEGLGRDCPRFSGGKYRRLETDSARAIQLPSYCVPR